MLEGEYKLNKFSKSDHEREILTMLAKRSKLLLEEQKKRISKPEDLESSEQLDELPKTFLSKYTLPRLNTIRERLIKANIIGDISENDFIYIFSGKPITEKMKLIKWKSSKVKAKNLLNKMVCEGFSNPIANKCFVLDKNPNNKIFDSNVKPTVGFPDIDDIFK